MLDICRNSLLSIFISCVGSVMIMSSCTRPGNNTALLSLNLANPQSTSNKLSALDINGETPVHIVVNITGSGMPSVFYAWDNRNGSTTAPAISLNVPLGTARLIQVLYVTQDSLRNLNFYYNDVTQDFISPNVSIALTVNSLGSTAIQGALIGRYLDLDGTGPTGILNTLFQPLGGKPSMIVDFNEIFGGWFRAFALPANGFSYQMDNGRLLLSNFSASSGNTDPSSRTLVSIPTHARNYGAGGIAQLENGINILAGFFGPGSVSKNVCLNATSGGTIPNLFTDVTLATGITWNATGSNCTTAQACLSAGGDKTGTGNCATPDNINGIKFRELALSSKDDLLLFHGPFQLTDLGSGNSSYLNANLSGSNLSVGWAFMPGSTVQIDGVEVFYTWLSTTAGGSNNQAYQTNNGYACNDLVSKYGFRSAGKFPTTTLSASNLNVGSSNGQILEVLVCPYNLSRIPLYFSSALEWKSGYSSGPAMATKIALKTITGASSTQIAQSICTPLQIVGLDANNFPAWFPYGIQVSFDSSANFIFLSNDCTLSTSSTSPTQIYNNQIIYYKNSLSAINSSATITLPTLTNAGNITASSPSLVLTIVAQPLVTTTQVLALPPSGIPTVPNACYPLNYTTVDPTSLVISPTNWSSFSPPTVSGLSYFSDSMCTTTAILPLQIPGTYPRAFWPLYFKYSGALTSFDINLITSGPTAKGPVTVNIVNPGPPTNVQMNFPNSVFVGSCIPLNAFSVDNNMNPSPLSGSGNLANSNGFGFFSDPACVGASSSVLSFTGGTSASPMVYAKAQTVISNATISAIFSNLFTYPLSPQITSLPIPTKINLYADTNPAGSNSGNCQPIMITLEDIHSWAAPAISSLNVTLTASSYTFYSEKTCTTSSATVTFSLGDTAKLWFFKTILTSGPNSIFTTNNGVLQNANLGVTSRAAGSAGSITNHFENGASNLTHIKLGICQPYMTYLYNSTSYDAIAGSGTVALTGPGMAPIFSDAACTNTTISALSAEQARIIYIRPIAPSGVAISFGGSIGAIPNGGGYQIYVDP